MEGVSDTLTLLYVGFARLGVPGANQTRLLEVHHFEGVERVFDVRETR